MGSFYQEYPVRTRPITGLLAESMKGTERAVEGTALSGQENRPSASENRSSAPTNETTRMFYRYSDYDLEF